MARKNRRGVPKEDRRTTADYYKLHTDAVEELVNADESNSPEVSESELRKYRSGPNLRLTDWAKAILIKMWFAGSVCFFIFWGLGGVITAQLDLLLVFAIALGIATDLLTNNVLRFFAASQGANDRWMMFPQKRYVSFPLNIVYAAVLLVCVAMTYSVVNLALLRLTVAEGAAPLGVEPVAFGALYTCFDLFFLFLRRVLRSILSDARRAVKS